MVKKDIAKKIIKRSLLLGMGILSLTKDEIQKFAKDLKGDGVVSEKEGRKLVKDIFKMTTKHQKKATSILRSHVKKALDEMPLATKDDLKALERRLLKAAKKKSKKR